MSGVYFTADSHFGHARICEFSNRPFANVWDMDEALIAQWNAVVRPGDRVYHLGDFALCDVERAVKIARRLAGQKFLVAGNHDKRLRQEPEFQQQWIWIKDVADIQVDEQKIVLMHYAMRVWNQSHHGAWQLHGHSHGSLRDDPHALQLDVGVDCWGYGPVSFAEIRRRMSQKDYQPVDHHGARPHEQR